MIEIAVTPTATLNASKVAIQLNSAQEFGMQFAVSAFGKVTVDGEEVWGQNPLYSGLLNVTGDAWNNWGSDVDDATYVGDLALAQLGLTRAPEEAPEAPAEEAEEAEEEASE
mgnify:FL=1|tara:strand:+ start:36 stop:371 length:336 start_codon:yes stop_codon:yes gene_type:complete